MTSDFIAQRAKKTFQTNYIAGLSPKELLSAAAGAISGLRNTETGQKVWSIDNPLPLQGHPGALYVYAVARYPVATIGGTVGLTLGAIPQGDAGIQFIAVIEDSMGWDLFVAENIADVALAVISNAMMRGYPQHGGWRMTGGAWRFQHRFDAPQGIPPDPPQVETYMEDVQAYMPEDFFHNPATARVFGAQFPGATARTLIGVAADNLGDGWTLEFADEMIDGVEVPNFLGHKVLPSGAVLYVFGSCPRQGSTLWLLVQFGDSTHWTSQHMIEAMNITVLTLNTTLQRQFGIALEWLPPPG